MVLPQELWVSLPLLLALSGGGGVEAPVEDLFALPEGADGHQNFSEEERPCPTPAGSLEGDTTLFPSLSDHCFPASRSHSLLSRSMSAASSEPPAGTSKVTLSSRVEVKPIPLMPYQKYLHCQEHLSFPKE